MLDNPAGTSISTVTMKRALEWTTKVLRSIIGVRLSLRWRKQGGWLGSHLRQRVPQAPRKSQIEAVARTTNNLGVQKLDDAYGEAGGVRMPNDVRSSGDLGDLYAWSSSSAGRRRWSSSDQRLA